MSASADAIQQLTERLERLEAQNARIQTEVTTHLRRADVAFEDVVAALEVLRARIEALEQQRVAGPA